MQGSPNSRARHINESLEHFKHCGAAYLFTKEPDMTDKKPKDYVEDVEEVVVAVVKSPFRILGKLGRAVYDKI